VSKAQREIREIMETLGFQEMMVLLPTRLLSLTDLWGPKPPGSFRSRVLRETRAIQVILELLVLLVLLVFLEPKAILAIVATMELLVLLVTTARRLMKSL
jgi:hypothetical protein